MFSINQPLFLQKIMPFYPHSKQKLIFPQSGKTLKKVLEKKQLQHQHQNWTLIVVFNFGGTLVKPCPFSHSRHINDFYLD